jgi:hypothetical protein
MRFFAHHNVTAEDVARAMRLARRPAEVLINVVLVVALAGILAQVLYSFFIYLTAATGAPIRLPELLRMDYGVMNAIFGWLSILITALLPVFLFYALRTLAEMIWPTMRVRRLLKTSDIVGPTAYTIDEQGVRCAKSGGTDTFMPWPTFDHVKFDADIAALTTKGQLRVFVPLSAFGLQREQVAAEIQARVGALPPRPNGTS